MKKSILKYGGYASLAELILFVLTWLVIKLFNLSHAVQGYIGWADLLLPLIFVYFGIKYYRDHFNKGRITFLRAIGIGLLIVLLPAVAYAIIETVYVAWIDPHFYKNLYKYDLQQYHKTLSPAAYAVKTKQMQQQLALSNNPGYNFCIMLVTIISLGVIASLISALALFKKTTR